MRVVQRLHPLLCARADDVLDLGGEPEEDEEVPEAQVDVDALAVLARAREVDAVVQGLAREAAPTEARKHSDRGLGRGHDVAADARPLGLLRGVVHARDAGLDLPAALGDAGLLGVHAYGPGVAPVAALDEVLLEVTLAEHVVGLAEHEAHEFVRVERGAGSGHAGRGDSDAFKYRERRIDRRDSLVFWRWAFQGLDAGVKYRAGVVFATPR